MQTAPAPGPARDANDGGGAGAAGDKASLPGAPVPRRRSPEEEPTEYWSYELFGCLSDWRLCCATFLCPCYTLGRNAAYFGDNGTMAAVLCVIGFVAVRNSITTIVS